MPTEMPYTKLGGSSEKVGRLHILSGKFTRGVAEPVSSVLQLRSVSTCFVLR